MKSIKFIFLLAIFSLFVFNSCTGEDEPIDPLLLGEEPTLCTQPAFFNVSSFINGNTVRIDWDKTSGDEWEIQYGTSGFVLGTGTVVIFNSTSSLITGLTSTTNYSFYIRTKCEDNDYSQWIGPIAPGSSIDVCVNPTNLSAVRSTTDPTKITATWSANGDENSWQVQYGTTGFVIGSGTIVATSSPSKTISSLLGNVSYDFYVRSNCDANQNSGWVGPVTVNAVGVLGCTTPTDLAVVRNTTFTSQVNVSWTAGGSETSWEIQYGNTGFAVGTGTSSIATTNPKIITGLQATSYDFYIRAKCSATQNSSWFGPINIAAVQAVDNTPALMTANIAGVQYSNMRPYLYSLTNIDVKILNNGAPLGDPRYLWIQGDTSDNLSILSEINLYIPNNLWSAGTHTLFEVNNFEDVDFCQVRMLTNPGATVLTTNNITGGTITITEFNLVSRRVKGTFSFTYQKIVDGNIIGDFAVTNGTFNYALDDDYFN